MNKQAFFLVSSLLMIAAAIVALSSAGPVVAGGPAHITGSDVYDWWDGSTSVGTSQLVRNGAGISASYHVSGLPAGQAMTLWFIFFNNPENCATSPCSIPEDVFNPAANADFYFAGGHVTGGSGNGNFGGHLNVGDMSRSGKAETGMAPAVPLTNPYGAEVVLALHSHGPAQTGLALQHQISSFLGGCETFNGPNGFAGGDDDVPDAVGECSTFQYSLHQGQ
jgi:hypothetical protein